MVVKSLFSAVILHINFIGTTVQKGVHENA